MSDTSSVPPPPPPEPETRAEWRDQRQAWRDWKRERRASGRHGWRGPGLGGAVLLIIGVLLLMQNFGYHLPDRWWAAFLLIPAVGAFVGASRIYRAEGRLGREGTAAMVAGFVFTAAATAIYSGIGWGIFWPAILIVIGAGILLRSYAWRR